MRQIAATLQSTRPAVNGGSTGDLLTEIQLAKHEILERDGGDLRCAMLVGPASVALGGKIYVIFSDLNRHL